MPKYIRNRDGSFPARWYRIDLPANAPLATVLMLDSNQPNLSAAEWSEQTHWLEAELSKPRNPPWLICCATIRCSAMASPPTTAFCNATGNCLQKVPCRFLSMRPRAQSPHLEIAGWSISFILAGGGGGLSHPMIRDNRGPFHDRSTDLFTLKFSRRRPSSVSLAPTAIPCIDGATKAGQTTVQMSTPSDSAIAKPLEGIIGIYDKVRAARKRSQAPGPQPNCGPPSKSRSTNPAPWRLMEKIMTRMAGYRLLYGMDLGTSTIMFLVTRRPAIAG